jgi:hypothetical protein
MHPISNSRLRFSLRAAIVLLFVGAVSGCNFQNAVLDGLFVGVSDTIAGIISGIALGTLGLG